MARPSQASTVGSIIKEHRVNTHRKLAVLAGVAALALVPAGTAQAGGQKGTPPKCGKQSKKKCNEGVTGRMTGHGQTFTADFGKVQWEFRNQICRSSKLPDLKVSWYDTNGVAQKFVLRQHTSGGPYCYDTALSEGKPLAGFDTMTGTGTGTLNGVAGHTISYTFTDEGEPGRDDSATFRIAGPGGTIEFDGKALDGGNHQAHRVTGSAAG
jgi:hypothetical protein